MQSGPVFVVGPSRSGTTLLQEALSLHARIHISAETHWFDDLRCRCPEQISSDAGRREIQDWFMALSHRPFGHSGEPGKGWLDRELLEQTAQSLNANNPSAKPHAINRDCYLKAYCQLDAQQHNKLRWGEKTPRHVFRIEDIRQSCPDAKFLCILRDPRAMVSSYREWSKRAARDFKSTNNNPQQRRENLRSRASYHPAIASLMWRGAARASIRAQQRLGEDRVKIVRYEDLVSNAESCLRDIADWLGETFDPAMLEVPMINSSFDEYHAGAGFRTNTGERWQTKLSAAEKAVVRLLCRREMIAHDYQTRARSQSTDELLWPLRAVPHFLTLPFAVWRAARANQDRTGNLFSYVWRRISP